MVEVHVVSSLSNHHHPISWHWRVLTAVGPSSPFCVERSLELESRVQRIESVASSEMGISSVQK